MKAIVAIGATSCMVFEAMRTLASEGLTIVLAGRDLEKLEVLASDLKARNAKVHTIVNELSTENSPVKLRSDIESLSVEVDAVLIGYGVLPDQSKLLFDAAARNENYQVNFISPLEHALTWYQYFKERKIAGTIAVIGSVAGDRGRGSNFFYGSAKAGLDSALSGLRNIAFADGIQVVTIKPGFVDSPMTADIKKGLLFTSGAKAGALIAQAIRQRKDIAYVPMFWQLIMTIIVLIPEKLFKRLKL